MSFRTLARSTAGPRFPAGPGPATGSGHPDGTRHRRTPATAGSRGDWGATALGSRTARWAGCRRRPESARSGNRWRRRPRSSATSQSRPAERPSDRSRSALAPAPLPKREARIPTGRRATLPDARRHRSHGIQRFVPDHAWPSPSRDLDDPVSIADLDRERTTATRPPVPPTPLRLGEAGVERGARSNRPHQRCARPRRTGCVPARRSRPHCRQPFAPAPTRNRPTLRDHTTD